MKCLFMSPHGPATVMRHLLLDGSVYMQVPPDSVIKAQEGNHFFGLPRKQDIAFTTKNILLSSEFYSGCLKKIMSNPAALCGFELDEMNDSIGSVVRNLRDSLVIPASSPDKSYESVKAIVRLVHLLRWVTQAHPATPRFVNYQQNLLFGNDAHVTLERCAQEADEVWRTADMFYGHQIEGLIRSYEPDLVFCQAIIPNALSFAVATALNLRSLCPKAKVVLINGEWNLTSTIAHFRDKMLTKELFEIFDGAIVYSDLQPLTICDVVQALASGKGLHEVENVACRHDGAIVFKEPTSRTFEYFFKESSLHRIYDKVSPFPFENDQEGSIADVASPLKFALVFPSQQACYWNRCKFCTINTQNVLIRDPYIGKRGDEAVNLLLTLKGEGIGAAYLGREAVAPEILQVIVDRLRGVRDVIPWGFEGRFGQYLSTEFIDALTSCGCAGAVFGLETSSDRLNKLVNKYGQDVDISMIERIIGHCTRSGMMVHVNTIVNLPGATQAEYDHHTEWLKTQFNKNPLFHFNTNHFSFFPSSGIGRNPEAYGLELVDPRENSGLQNVFGAEGIVGHGWNYLPETPQPDLSKDAWVATFHSGTRWGVNLETLHLLYHECYNVSSYDMIARTHCFKQLQSEIKSLDQIEALHISIPEHVAMKQIVQQGQQRAILFDKGMGTFAPVSNALLQGIQIGVQQDLPIGEVLDKFYSALSSADRENILKFIVWLVANDLVAWRQDH